MLNLTESIGSIYRDINISQPLKLQVLQIKSIAVSGSDVTRIKVIISDGTYFIQGMLSTQLNSLASQIKKYSVIQVDKYICNVVQNRRIVIILSITQVFECNERIGQSENIETVSGNSTFPAQSPQQTSGFRTEPQATGGFRNQMPVQSGYGQQQPPYSAQPVQPMPQNSGYAPQQTSNNNYAAHANPYGNVNNAPPSVAAPTVYPVSSLSPYQNKWTIKVRVTNKSEIKHWHNQRGEGKLFSCTLIDDSGEIKMTAFNTQVDTFYSILEDSKVYYISHCKVNIAKKQFSNVQNEYELTVEKDTLIEPCLDISDIPSIKFHFVDIQRLNDIQKDELVDVLAIAKETSDLSSITSKTTQKQVQKRDLVLVDASNYSVRVTLWGKQAENFNGKDSPVVAIKGAKVSDYGGRSLSLYSSSILNINPDIAEAHKLRGWYENVGRNSSFQTFSGGALGVGKSGNDKKICLDQSKLLGMNDKPDYFSVKATVSFVKNEGFSYPACPEPDCNKKLTQDGQQWRCEKNGRLYDAPDHRYILNLSVTDHSGQVWLTGFNEVANTLLGVNANELVQWKQLDDPRFAQVFENCLFKDFVFKARAKQETYGDETKVRMSIMNANKVDYGIWAKELVGMIGELEKA